MIRYASALIFLSILSLLSACGESPHSTHLEGGINVGNSMRGTFDQETVEYISPFKYRIAYAKVLTRTVKENGKEVTIDNSEWAKSRAFSSLAKQIGETSRLGKIEEGDEPANSLSSVNIILLTEGKDYPVEIKQEEKGRKQVQRLWAYFSASDPKHQYHEIDFPGAHGVFSKQVLPIARYGRSDSSVAQRAPLCRGDCPCRADYQDLRSRHQSPSDPAGTN
jgi:hypothetical protein